MAVGILLGLTLMLLRLLGLGDLCDCANFSSLLILGPWRAQDLARRNALAYKTWVGGGLVGASLVNCGGFAHVVRLIHPGVIRLGSVWSSSLCPHSTAGAIDDQLVGCTFDSSCCCFCKSYVSRHFRSSAMPFTLCDLLFSHGRARQVLFGTRWLLVCESGRDSEDGGARGPPGLESLEVLQRVRNGGQSVCTCFNEKRQPAGSPDFGCWEFFPMWFSPGVSVVPQLRQARTPSGHERSRGPHLSRHVSDVFAALSRPVGRDWSLLKESQARLIGRLKQGAEDCSYTGASS